MLEWIIKKRLQKEYDGYEKDLAMLHIKRLKMHQIASIMFLLILFMPVIAILTFSLLNEKNICNTLLVFIFGILYYSFVFWFIKNLPHSISEFILSIGDSLHFKYYTKKGKAITKEDFEKIKKGKEKLYFVLEHQLTRGACYAVCFEILKLLKSGKILFIAVKSIADQAESEEERKCDYTMHVLFVKGNWCFDSNTQRQFELHYLLEKYRARVYRSYSYKDVENLDYNNFSLSEYDALEKWCKDNNCYQEWQKK